MARGPLAGASGPGKFSVRTDGLDLGSIAYGEGGETRAIKDAMPLAETPDVRGARASDVRAAARRPVQVGTRLYDASIRPDEDVMTGAPIGPGAGPEVLGMAPQPIEKYSDTLAKLLPFDETGEIAVLYQDFLARGL